MAFTNTKESGLESLIVKWLVEQNGYEEGTNADYNKEYAVDETRLFQFLQDTQPKEMDKLLLHSQHCRFRFFQHGVQTTDNRHRENDVTILAAHIHVAQAVVCDSPYKTHYLIMNLIVHHFFLRLSVA